MNNLIRLVALVSFTYTVALLLKTSEITYYINPRFVPLTKLSLAFLFVLTFFTLVQFLLQISSGLTIVKNKVKGASILVLLAFLTPLDFPPKMMDTSMAEQKGMMSVQKAAPQRPDSSENVEPEQAQIVQSNGDLIKDFSNSEGVIQITPVNYLEVFLDIIDYQDRYLGKEIEVDGFILHHETLGPNKYLVARYVMACCAADAAIIGFVAEGSTPLPENSWVKIRGEILRVDKENQPIVKVINIETIEPPTEPYIYPYY